MNATTIEEEAPSHSMTYAEREKLKSFAAAGNSLPAMLLAIAHWMREGMDVSFSGYIANWAEANRDQVWEVEAIREQWPLSGPRFIADNSSTWGSAIPDA